MWHMKDNGQGIFFVKMPLLIKIPVKVLEAIEAGKKSPFKKKNTRQLFSFLAKPNFWKDSYTTTLYKLDFDLHMVDFIMQKYPVTRE